MQRIDNLEDLLWHYIKDLYAAELQLMEALPAIIEKARHQSLANALQHHLSLSNGQLNRLEEITKSLASFQVEATGTSVISVDQLQAPHSCLGMMALQEEADLLVHGNIDETVLDAAIIGCVQKMEHYEICGYGTALAYATELNIQPAIALLTETLDEEYDADDLLTALAMASYNKRAEPIERRRVTHKQSNADDAGLYTSRNHNTNTHSTRKVQSPGGRAGTSHRGYASGESRGH